MLDAKESSDDENLFRPDDLKTLNVQQLGDLLSKTKGETDLDRQLLLGVLVRDSCLRHIDEEPNKEL